MTPHNHFVWVDIPVHDLNRAIGFYTALIDAPITREGGPGFFFGLLPHADQGVGGCLVHAPQEHGPAATGPLVYLNVSGRLREAVRAAQEHGGTILQAVHQIGEHGWRAVILDSEGNRLALHAPHV